MKRLFSAVMLAVLVVQPGSGDARSLESIKDRGSLGVCAHPNALPYSSRKDGLHGFQLELAGELAKALGVSLNPEWIVGGVHRYRADCDIIMDAIDVPEVQSKSRLELSRPYYHTGVVLAVRRGSPIKGWQDLSSQNKVGVLVGSYAAMVLGRHHVGISTFAFEDDSLDSLAKGEVDAVTVNYVSASYYNGTHPGSPIELLGFDEAEPSLAWNAAVGMRQPDADLHRAIDAALARLAADGTIARIYGHYGITVQPPK